MCAQAHLGFGQQHGLATGHVVVGAQLRVFVVLEQTAELGIGRGVEEEEEPAAEQTQASGQSDAGDEE